MRTKPNKIDWFHISISFVLLTVAAVFDATRPFDRSWSILYFLVPLYTVQYLRGWPEFLSHIAVFLCLFLVPLTIRPDTYSVGPSLFNRIVGMLAGIAIVVLMRDRRTIITALRRANTDLESTISERTFELRTANEFLQREIAERWQTEEMIRKISEFRETLIRTAAEGICVYYFIPQSPFIAFSVWNERMTEITGYTMDEINRLGWCPAIFPDLEVQHRARKRMDLIQKGENMRAEEWEITRKDGERRIVAISTNAVETELGENSVVALIYDISNRKRAEEALQMMRVCVDRADDSVFWVSSEGFLTYVNEAACADRGYSREELLKMTVFDLEVDAEYQPDLWARYFDDLRKGGAKTVETRHRTKDGRIFPVEISANFVDINDHQFIFAFVRDVTRRRQTDEELRSSRQRLESLSRQLITTQEVERRHLARELHDEIGQVLTAIKMNLRRTHLAADERLKTSLEENIKMVDGAISQARNLSLSLRPPQLDELGLVAALHWLVKHQAHAGGFESQLDVDLGDVQIPADIESVCFRIAQEALTNSIRHGQPTRIVVKLSVSGNDLFLSIRDDGIGFDVGECRRRAMAGGSIGLISMQERASLIGGRAEIASTPGNGTSVEVCIPLSPTYKTASLVTSHAIN